MNNFSSKSAYIVPNHHHHHRDHHLQHRSPFSLIMGHMSASTRVCSIHDREIRHFGEFVPTLPRALVPIIGPISQLWVGNLSGTDISTNDMMHLDFSVLHHHWWYFPGGQRGKCNPGTWDSRHQCWNRQQMMHYRIVERSWPFRTWQWIWLAASGHSLSVEWRFYAIWTNDSFIWRSFHGVVINQGQRGRGILCGNGFSNPGLRFWEKCANIKKI